MIIGCPKEIKDQERRVGLTPAGVYALVRAGHTVYMEHNAGLASGFTDEEYVAEGAQILPDGPAVGSVSLSPRGGLNMPSDASAALWKAEIEALKAKM